MSLKLLTIRPLKLRGLVKLLLFTILLTIATRLLWERAMLLHEATQIRQVVETFNLALKNRDADLAYAQCLPLEQGGKLSQSEIRAILNSNGWYFDSLYLRSELDLLRSKMRPIWIEGRIVLEAHVNGTNIYDSPNTMHFLVLLRKWSGRWYIIRFSP